MSDQVTSPQEPSARDAIKSLFERAQKQGTFEYTLTLLRVGGVDERPDPFVALLDETSRNPDAEAAASQRQAYCRFASLEDPVALIWNLLSCASARAFRPFPFGHLITGTPPHYVRPTAIDRVRELVRYAEELREHAIKEAVIRCYRALVEGGCIEGVTGEVAGDEQFARQFWKDLVETYFAARKEFGREPRLLKWPRFEVLEVLCDDELGLYGFRVYFSNGSHAEWVRRKEYAMGVNVLPREDVNFMAGDLDALKDEWRVGDKPLYEIGLPGRYNDLGEWRPLMYEGATESITREIQTVTSDPELQGALFYVQCTCHWVIEFALRANVDLPYDNAISFGTQRYPINLWKCPHQDNWDRNICVYDGWVRIHSPSVEEIEAALSAVRLALSRLAFTFDADISWRMKYSGLPDSIENSLAKPTRADIAHFEKVLVELPYIIDFAIDWYNRGRASRNPFTAFLCYFVAIEIIVHAAYDGDEDLGLNPQNLGRAERRRKRLECIEQLKSNLLETDPQRFVETAYSECVKSLNRRRREVCELVFGPAHGAMPALFTDTDEKESLTTIRNWLAHGGVSLVDREHEKLVRERLREIADISKEFLMRVLLRLRSEQTWEDWSRVYTFGRSFTDPRSIRVTNSDKMLPQTSWLIQPAWCE